MGRVSRCVRGCSGVAAELRLHAAKVLAGLHMVRHPASYFVWLPMPNEVRADTVAMQLKQEGILVSTAAPYAMGSQPPHAIRLALGSVSHSKLKPALEAVERVVAGLSY